MPCHPECIRPIPHEGLCWDGKQERLVVSGPPDPAPTTPVDPQLFPCVPGCPSPVPHRDACWAPKSCSICGATWTAPIKDCPVCSERPPDELPTTGDFSAELVNQPETFEPYLTFSVSGTPDEVTRVLKALGASL